MHHSNPKITIKLDIILSKAIGKQASIKIAESSKSLSPPLNSSQPSGETRSKNKRRKSKTKNYLNQLLLLSTQTFESVSLKAEHPSSLRSVSGRRATRSARP